MDKGFVLRGGTGGAFRSRHSSLTWRGKEHSGLATDQQGHGAGSALQGQAAALHCNCRAVGTERQDQSKQECRDTQQLPEVKPMPSMSLLGQNGFKRYCLASASCCRNSASHVKYSQVEDVVLGEHV